MRGPQSDDKPRHADLHSYQIDREPREWEPAFNFSMHQRVVTRPPHDGGMRQRQATLRHHFHKVAVAELETEIPSHAQDDDLPVKVAALEQIIAGSAGGISPPAAHRTVRKPLDLHGSSQPLSCRLTTTVDAESDRSSRFLGWRPPSLSWVIRFAPRPLQAPRRYYRMIRPLHAHRYFPPSCSALIGFSLSIA
jgi:hypothetical protein